MLTASAYSASGRSSRAGCLDWEDVDSSFSCNGVFQPKDRARFSLYTFPVVSEEQIQKWANEAEAGYDVADLKRRGRGRPGRGAEPMQVVAVRLTTEELKALDDAAARHQLSRSEAIRAALSQYAA